MHTSDSALEAVGSIIENSLINGGSRVEFKVCVRVKVVDWQLLHRARATKKTNLDVKMDILIEQEANMNTIAALSIAALKTDKNQTVMNRQVQTDIVKGFGLEVLDFKSVPVNGAFNNLPPADPVEIYFKDLSYSVQKMFSKC